MLSAVTDLFVHGSVRFSDDEIALFDDVLTRLALEIEVSVRSLLARRLAPITKGPPNIIRILATDDEISVACPILVQSEPIDQATLVQCARSKTQEHLLAISRRKSLSEVITDVLVERGNKQVVLSTAKIRSRFSANGFPGLSSAQPATMRLPNVLVPGPTSLILCFWHCLQPHQKWSGRS